MSVSEQTSAPVITIATNNGDVGGGEVMLLNIARALRQLGIRVLVIGPRNPSELLCQARAEGFTVVELPAHDRLSYMLALARWRLRNLRVPLWCNGLVPSLATAGMGPRIVHLHLLPEGRRRAAAALARIGARTVLVPSRFMAERVRGSRVFANWTQEIPAVARPVRDNGGPVRIGFIGRLSEDKGIVVLCETLTRIAGSHDIEFVIAGEPRFVNPAQQLAVETALSPLTHITRRLGWVNRAEFFAQVDIAVFPSVFPEPFGLVAAESMSAGIPFVISDAGALPEVAGGSHPFIARRGSSSSLVQAIGKAIEAVSRHQVDTTPPRKRWERCYSEAAGLRRTSELLDDLVSPRRAGSSDMPDFTISMFPVPHGPELRQLRRTQ